MRNFVINFLAVLGALDCILVPLLFTSGQQPLFPLPGLYLLEIGLAGSGACWLILQRRAPHAPWIAGGILLAFVILGAWTIGFFLTPALLGFTGAGALWLGKPDKEMLRAFGIFMLAAILQAALMLALISAA